MKTWLLYLVWLGCCWHAAAQQPLLRSGAAAGYRPLQPVSIVVDSAEPALVQQAARMLQHDLQAVIGKTIPIAHRFSATPRGTTLLVGTLAGSSWLQQWQQAAVWRPAIRAGQWEAYEVSALELGPGTGQVLLLAGSDRRGAAYAVAHFCRQLGVSPWYWWADVPVVAQKNLYYLTKGHLADSPGVRYRGIFINDEAPALSGWSREKFGGFNHRFYEKVFELMVRLKANYLWPAMWGNAFYDDDSLNRQLADDWGIVIGTSHHEPMMRAHDEWRRYGRGQLWNYDSSKQALLAFWEKGLRRATNEKIVTIGMRGDGDEPMSRETATGLLQRIVADQRKLITAVTAQPADATPQLWALYKEVQDYYDEGMQVPDDVTLLFADDNWGNIRRLPNLNDAPRRGGYGIYYHFDYVGGPRNYKWINTNHVSRIWEQMHLAWQYQARQIWIVNVGDIKPMELPISFFLDMAWRPDAMTLSAATGYTQRWASEQFGKKHSSTIAALLDSYTKINSRRKPELIDARSFSFEQGEWQRLTAAYQQLARQAIQLQPTLPKASQSAYFQLVQHPVQASANLYEMYYHVAANDYWYRQGDTMANKHARLAAQCFRQDSLISVAYHQINGGKWNHMMSQTHIGYTSWQQPPYNVMPAVKFLDKPTNSRTTPHLPGWCISIPATSHTQQQAGIGVSWRRLPGHSRSGFDAMTTWPVTHAAQSIDGAPRLGYQFQLPDTAACWLQLQYSPSLNYWRLPHGMQIAVQYNGQWLPTLGVNDDEKKPRVWDTWVSDNIIRVTIRLPQSKPGLQNLQIAHLHPGLVLQHVLVYSSGWRPTNLSPPAGLWFNQAPSTIK